MQTGCYYRIIQFSSFKLFSPSVTELAKPTYKMNTVFGALIFAAVLALSASAPAITKEIDWAGILRQLDVVERTTVANYQAIVEIATRDNRAVGADIDAKVKESIEEAYGIFDQVRTSAKDESLFPLLLRLQFIGVGNGIYFSHEETEEDRLKLSQSAQDEAVNAYYKLYQEFADNADELMALLCVNDETEIGCGSSLRQSIKKIR